MKKTKRGGAEERKDTDMPVARSSPRIAFTSFGITCNLSQSMKLTYEQIAGGREEGEKEREGQERRGRTEAE